MNIISRPKLTLQTIKLLIYYSIVISPWKYFLTFINNSQVATTHSYLINASFENSLSSGSYETWSESSKILLNASYYSGEFFIVLYESIGGASAPRPAPE